MNPILPALRPELTVLRVGNAVDGSPVYHIHDPVVGQFYKVGWVAAQIMRFARPGMKSQELAHAIKHISTAHISAEEIDLFYQFAQQYHLIAAPVEAKTLIQKKKSGGWFAKLGALLQKQLYISIPLWDPDAFLQKNLWFAKLFVSGTALSAYALCGFFGVVSILSHASLFWSTLLYFFTPIGFLSFALVLIVVKVVHEFAHAFCAKAMGLRVPEMGVALMMLWPVLYCDVTDAWRLKDRKERLIISSAGLLSELAIACVASFLWAISDVGLLQSIFFMLASTTWITSLVINLNPAMRFDGYFVLNDLMRIDNLQETAQNTLRWAAQKLFLGIQHPPPEPDISTTKTAGLIVLGIGGLVWRFSLYFGLLWLALSTMPFLLTVIFGGTVFVFTLAIPAYREYERWKKIMQTTAITTRVKGTFVLLGLIAAYLIIPLPHLQHCSAIVVAKQSQVIYAPADGFIIQSTITKGQTIKSGDLLFEMDSPPLRAQHEYAYLEMQAQEKELLHAKTHQKREKEIKTVQEQLSKATSEYEMLLARMQWLFIRSSIDGTVSEWSGQKNMNVSEGAVLGHISSTDAKELLVFLPETLATALYEGSSIRFYYGNSVEEGTVSAVSVVEQNTLPYESLASIYGGPLAVNPAQKLELLETYYVATCSLNNGQLLKNGQTGTVAFRGHWSSLLFDTLAAAKRGFFDKVM